MKNQMTLKQLVEDELLLLSTGRGQIIHLRDAINSGRIGAEEEHDARVLLAYSRKHSGYNDTAAEEFERLGDTEQSKECYRRHARALSANYQEAEAGKLLIKIGDVDDAIWELSKTDISLTDILALLPGEREDNIRRVVKSRLNHSLLAECYAELGDHRSAAQELLKSRRPDYDKAIKHLEAIPDYLAAAELCLEASADHMTPRDKEYCLPAFDYLVKAGEFDRAIELRVSALSGWSGGVEDIHSIYVAQGKEDPEAWRLTAETIRTRARRGSQLSMSLPTAYEQAGMFIEAGDALLEDRPNENWHKALEDYVAGGMTESEAAKTVLGSYGHFYNWVVGELCEKAELWAEAITAYEKQRDYTSGSNALKNVRKLAPLYEKVGRLSDAADAYEKIGETYKAIECRRAIRT